MCHLGQLLHHILGHKAEASLPVIDFGGVWLVPVTRVVRVTLGTIHIGIEFVAGHKAEEVLCHLHTIRNSVVPLYNPTVLHICIVIKCNAREILCTSVKHLLQGSKSIEYSICILTEDHQLGLPSRRGKAHHMAVILGLGEYIPFYLQCSALAVCRTC